MSIKIDFIFHNIFKNRFIIYSVMSGKHTYNRTIKNRHIIGYVLKVAFVIIIHFYAEDVTYLCYYPFCHKYELL